MDLDPLRNPAEPAVGGRSVVRRIVPVGRSGFVKHAASRMLASPRTIRTKPWSHEARLGGRLRSVALQHAKTLEDVLRWGGDVVDVIVQDEYTHDVIVAYAGGGGPSAGFLVFDTT
jgi:hypothetical protein